MPPQKYKFQFSNFGKEEHKEEEDANEIINSFIKYSKTKFLEALTINIWTLINFISSLTFYNNVRIKS